MEGSNEVEKEDPLCISLVSAITPSHHNNDIHVYSATYMYNNMTGKPVYCYFSAK